MAKKLVNVFMIDDHPAMIEGYKSILAFNNLDIDINTTVAYTCEAAYNIIFDIKNKSYFDFAFIDLKLPCFSEKNIENGLDLAILIKENLINCKIIMITSHAEAIDLDAMERNLAPNGILVKSDFTADEFLIAFENIYNNQIYKSKSVIESLAAFQDISKNKE